MIEMVALALITCAMPQAILLESLDHCQDGPPHQASVEKAWAGGKNVAWLIELSEFDLQYESCGPMKTQFMADFLAEFASNVQATLDWWNLYVDGASNMKGRREGIILEGLNNVTLDHTLI